MKVLVLIFSLLSGVAVAKPDSLAKPPGVAKPDSCAICREAKAIELQLAKLPPDPLDPRTAEAQMAQIERTSELASKALAAPLPEDAALALIQLLVKIAPYDNGLVVAQDNHDAFRSQYRRRNGTLAPALEQLVKEKKITPQERKDLLEAFEIVRAGKSS